MDFTRATYTPTRLDLVNALGRGGTEDWRVLYQRAKTDAMLRLAIAQALPLVDPELGETGELWEILLTALNTRYPLAHTG